MPGISSLLAVADAYGTACAVPEKTVSKRALQDSSRLTDLRTGSCDIGVKRLERTLQWFSDNWPADAAWPPSVLRPAASDSALSESVPSIGSADETLKDGAIAANEPPRDDKPDRASPVPASELEADLPRCVLPAGLSGGRP